MNLFDNFAIWHLSAFVLFFIVCFGFEYFSPLRTKFGDTKKRWLHNWSLSLVNSFFIRVLSFITPVGVAIYLEQQGFGFFNMISFPLLGEFLFTIIILDFCIYLQHIASHKFSWFWKLHQIHHSDESLDVSTALRFHTGEIGISLLYKVFLVGIFGFSAFAIIAFEIILACSAVFNHANLKLPKKIEKYMSYVFVTPQFHQVHHSVIHTETDSNYGFFFSFWDRLFRTYTPHQFFVKKLGLNYVKEDLSFWELLALNVKKK